MITSEKDMRRGACSIPGRIRFFGVKSMKQQLFEAAEKISIPSQVLGASRLEITGTHQILLIGHKGIRSYGETEMIVDLDICALKLQGSGFYIKAMTRQELLIGGNITGLVFLR